MLGNVAIKARPLRFAYLIDPGSASQARAAIRLASTLWGGALGPIVQLFRRMPVTWRDHGLPAPPAKSVVLGYLEAFDPDFLIQFSDAVPAFVTATGRTVIKPSEVWQPLRQGLSRSPTYGIGILEVLEGVFDEHFKYTPRFPVKVVLPSIPESHGLFWSALFGELDPDVASVVEREYFAPLDIEKVEGLPDTLGTVLGPRVLFPRRLVQHGLRRERRNFAVRGDATVFFMDASRVADIIDFWNLRALGRPVLGLPKQLNTHEALRTQLIDFLRSHRRHWRNNPAVCDTARFIRSRHSTMDEMQAYAKSLNLAPPVGDSSKDGFYALQHWYPRLWDPWARDKDAAIPDDFYSDDDESVELSDSEDMSIRLPTVLPDFAEARGVFSQAQSANEITFNVFGTSDFLAEAFPTQHGRSVLRAIGGIGLDDEWRLGRNGIVKLVTGVNGTYLKIPKAEEVFFAWLTDDGWKPELSTPGILAKQIRRQCEGHISFLTNPKILSLLEHMNGGNVTPEGRPMDRDKLPAERSLAVEHVRSLLRKADPKADLHTRLLSRNVFRLGAQGQCPSCHRRSWFSLNDLKERMTCQKCLSVFPAAGTLDRSVWAYKTTGPFSVPNHADGAYAVLLGLQCLDRFGRNSLQTTPVLSFKATKAGESELEADFAFLWQESVFGERRDGIVFGEAKTYGPFAQKDFRRMRQLARAFPGAILVFITLRDSLSSAEKREITRIARVGRKQWKPERPLNPVLVLTGTEVLNRHAPPYCWPEPARTQFQQRLHGLLALCDATQQIHLGLPSWQEDWQKAWDKKRARFLQKQKASSAGNVPPTAEP